MSGEELRHEFEERLDAREPLAKQLTEQAAAAAAGEAQDVTSPPGADEAVWPFSENIESLAETSYELPERRRAVFDDLERSRADDDAVDELGGSVRVLRRGDAEAGIQGDISEAAGPIDECR